MFGPELCLSYSQRGLGSQELGLAGQLVSRVMASSGGQTGPSHGASQGAGRPLFSRVD